MPAVVYPAEKSRALDALYVFAHGAGAPQSHPFMKAYAAGLAERGVTVVTFNFDYMEQRRGRPDRAPVLEATFRSAIADAWSKHGSKSTRLFIGGKSMGGRMSTHLGAALDEWPNVPKPSGIIVFGYPLKSGKQDRVSHLRRLTVPALIVQGTRDSFGGPDDVSAALKGSSARITVFRVETGDHSLAVLKASGKTPTESQSAILDAVVDWMKTYL